MSGSGWIIPTLPSHFPLLLGYGFPEDQIEVNISYSEGRFHVETAEFGLKHFVSAWTFKDYVMAVCGW